MSDPSSQDDLEIFRLVAESISDFVVITGTDGRIRYVNRAVIERFGYAADELVGRFARLFLAPQNPPGIIEELRAATAGSGFAGDVLNITKDGEEIWVSLKTAPVVREGRTVAMVAVSRDISERKRFEAELALTRDLALRSDRLKSEFLANVSHEIRTPMNAVIGMNQLLLDSDLSPEQREFASIIGESAASLLGIINEILDLSYVEAGRMRLADEVFELRAVVDDIARMFRTAAKAKSLTLETAVSPEVPGTVIGDAGRVRQVLTNLVGNAFKFTDRGTIRIELAVDRVEDGRVWLAGAVHDTGSGIAADDLERLFEPFVQADGSTTRRHGGTGLGLSIVRRLVQLMGGSVWVESEMGKGSVFRFILAVGESPDSAATPSLPPEEPMITDRRGPVLVVDDSPVNRRVTEHQLVRLGIPCHLVESGGAAVTAAASGGWAAILMDCQMPGVSGYDATAAIRAAESEGRRVPIVAMTAGVEDDDRKRGLEAGMDDVLVKPAAIADLARILGRWLTVSPRSESAHETADGGLEVVFDPSRLERVTRGRSGTQHRLLDLFVDEASELVAEIRQAAERADGEALRDTAHRLRGAALNVGATALAAAAVDLETIASGQAKAPFDAQRLDIVWGQTLERIRSILMESL
jgi:PAS domain S-box-containing protein